MALQLHQHDSWQYEEIFFPFFFQSPRKGCAPFAPRRTWSLSRGTPEIAGVPLFSLFFSFLMLCVTVDGCFPAIGAPFRPSILVFPPYYRLKARSPSLSEQVYACCPSVEACPSAFPDLLTFFLVIPLPFFLVLQVRCRLAY